MNFFQKFLSLIVYTLLFLGCASNSNDGNNSENSENLSLPSSNKVTEVLLDAPGEDQTCEVINGIYEISISSNLEILRNGCFSDEVDINFEAVGKSHSTIAGKNALNYKNHLWYSDYSYRIWLSKGSGKEDIVSNVLEFFLDADYLANLHPSSISLSQDFTININDKIIGNEKLVIDQDGIQLITINVNSGTSYKFSNAIPGKIYRAWLTSTNGDASQVISNVIFYASLDDSEISQFPFKIELDGNLSVTRSENTQYEKLGWVVMLNGQKYVEANADNDLSYTPSYLGLKGIYYQVWLVGLLIENYESQGYIRVSNIVEFYVE